MVPEGTGGPRERSKWVLFTSVQVLFTSVQGLARRHSTLNDRETCPCVSLVVGAVKNLSGINTPWQVDYPNPPLASALVAVTAPGVPEAGKRSPQERRQSYGATHPPPARPGGGRGQRDSCDNVLLTVT